MVGGGGGGVLHACDFLFVCMIAMTSSHSDLDFKTF